jgi:hypothetical protein
MTAVHLIVPYIEEEQSRVLSNWSPRYLGGYKHTVHGEDSVR